MGVSAYLKAFVAFIAPGAVVIGAAVTDESPGGSAITQGEWITALVACIVTGYGVLRVPNEGYVAPRSLVGGQGVEHGRKRRKRGRSFLQMLRDITWGG